MKLTKSKLKQLIKEELDNALLDELGPVGSPSDGNATRELMAIRKLLEKLPENIAAALVGLQGQKIPEPQEPSLYDPTRG